MIYETLQNDLTTAMKARDSIATMTLRGMIAEINKKKLDNKSKEVHDELCISVITKAMKQRDESIEAFKKGNRSDLIAKEEAEKVIIEKYMPKFLSEEETIFKIKEIIASVPDKNFGTIMKKVKEVPNVNMSTVAGLVKKVLS